ncbi:MAG: TIGR03084 family metal-binding protein [Reyranellaceae bacterium]
MLPQVADLRAEAAEFAGLLAALRDDDWQRPTLFKRWTVDDIVRHVHVGDLMALASATNAEAFAALMADIRAKREAGLSRLEETRQRLGGLAGRALLDRWQETLERLCGVLAPLPPQTRLPWAGPDMGVRMFTTARQMEVWSHAQAIWDLIGRSRPGASPRLRNIAEIGVRTFGWTYRNRGLPLPPAIPSVHLVGPSGDAWDWPQPPEGGSVRGEAVAFCQVVAQTRNVGDTGLLVDGEIARHWMSIAQCFAGPPETPPPPGSRHPAARGDTA